MFNVKKKNRKFYGNERVWTEWRSKPLMLNKIQYKRLMFFWEKCWRCQKPSPVCRQAGSNYKNFEPCT